MKTGGRTLSLVELAGTFGHEDIVIVLKVRTQASTCPESIRLMVS